MAMTNKNKFGVAGLLLLMLFPFPVVGQDGPMVIKLNVIHDGQEKSAPDHVTLFFNSHSVQILVRNGKFEVPAEAIGADKITFVTDIGDDHVQISKLSGKVLAMENWTLLLAERRYGDDYQWAVPKATKISASCMLVFDSVHADPGTVAFDPHCRSRRK
jgi:hypothetical protein